MADDDHSAEDRTEAGTPKRLEQAREAGQLPVSRDLSMLASLGGAALGCVALAPAAAQRMAEQCATLIGALDRTRLDDGGPFGGQISSVLLSAALLVGAVAVPAAAGYIGCGLMQTQFYVGGAPIRFQLSRISPAAGLARLLSSQHLLDFLKSLLRLVVLCLVVWSVLGRTPKEALAVAGADVAALLPVARTLVESLVRPLLIVLALFAGIDLLLVRFQHTSSMRMTREQVRIEGREADGDPFIKARLRSIRAQRSRRRMMAKVKTADVIITNPTHYAIALAYERGGATAPRVVAKGADLVAARIREEAQAHGVPLVPNAPLARALFQVELDQEIPAEHYRAVAEVIAYVWKLQNRAKAASAIS
jgi:flagellar biosynthetic protein FlhB